MVNNYRAEAFSVTTFVPPILEVELPPEPEIITEEEQLPDPLDLLDEARRRLDEARRQADDIIRQAEETRKQAEDELSRAKNEAADINKLAEAEAERILRDARAQAEAEAAELRETARREGHEEGYSDGLGVAEEELTRNLNDQMESLIRIIEEMEAARGRMHAEFESQVPELIIAIAEKTIKLEGEYDDNVFRYFVKNAIEQLRPENSVILRVSAADYDRYFPEGEWSLTLDNGAVVYAAVARDLTLPEWGCVLDDGEVSVDAGLETQLRAIKLAFDRADNMEDDAEGYEYGDEYDG